MAARANSTGAGSEAGGEKRDKVAEMDGKAGAGEKKAVATPALSASLVLLAPLEKPTADGFDYRVLLLKRHAKSRTYDSAHVMPGGNIDPIDQDATTWSSFFPSVAQDTIQRSTDSSALTAPELQALKLCALRETFEESGLLLRDPNPEPGPAVGLNSSVLASLIKRVVPTGQGADHSKKEGTPPQRWSALSPEKKLYWREEVHRDGKRFVDLLRSLGNNARPALSLLTHWSNWVTPTQLPRRFDTHFFIAVLPPAASPLVNPSAAAVPTASTPTLESLVSSDGTETTSADWLTPGEGVRRALAQHSSLAPGSGSGSGAAESELSPIILFPPQFNLFAELAQNHPTLSSLLDRSRSDSKHDSLLVKPRRVIPWVPQASAVVDDQGWKRRAMVLPGDEAYEYADPADKGLSQPGQRNRTYVFPPTKGQQGLAVQGCLRRGVQTTLGPGWEDMSAGDSGVSSATAKL
ncbi:hypothetical protein JCM10908_003324 [Rhodotorula pacifica]|uniref:NUDIX hydrolase n=1 Tax=Rhodotorula pacifica TaxID=1495444 RepID=UPI00317C46ED